MHNRYRRARGLALLLMAWLGALACAGEAMAWPQEVGPFVYAPGPDFVSVTDARTNKVVAKITVGGSIGDIQITPDGRTAYVDVNNTDIAAIDTATNTVVARIPGAGGGIKISSDGKSVYGVNGRSINVIDAATNTLKATTTVTQSISEMVVTQDGRIYVTDSSAGTLREFDAATNQLTATIAIGGGLVGLAVTPDGRRAVVQQQPPDRPNQVLIIDLGSKKLVASIEVYFYLVREGLAVSPDGRRAYAGGQLTFDTTSTVAVIDLEANAQIGGFEVGRALSNIRVTPDGKFVYVTGAYSSAGDIDTWGFISVFDARTFKRAGGIGVSDVPGAPVPTPDGKLVYVPMEGFCPGDIVPSCPPRQILVFSTAAGNQVVATIPGDRVPQIAIVPPPPGLPFREFKIAGLDITQTATPNRDTFNSYAYFTLGADSNGIRPDVEPVSVALGGFITTIPAGSFIKQADGSFGYLKSVNGVLYNASIRPQGGSRFLLHLSETGLNLPPTTNPVQVRLKIGDDSGLVAVKALLN